MKDPGSFSGKFYQALNINHTQMLKEKEEVLHEPKLSQHQNQTKI